MVYNRTRMPRTIFVLLPAYNEARSLTRLIPDLLQTLRAKGHAPRICVADDGSRDSTAQVLERYAAEPVTTIHHEKNRGYGAALDSGYRWILDNGHPGDLVIAMDADCTHPVEFIPSILEKFDNGFEVVTASYELPGGHATGVPLLRRCMSRVINAMFRAAVRIPGAHTYTNGFRGYAWTVLKQAEDRFGRPLIQETGFPGGVELFLKVSHGVNTVGEVPFDLRYERRGADSKIRIFSTIVRYLALWWRSRDWKPA